MTGRKVERAFWIAAPAVVLATMAAGVTFLLSVGAKVEGIVHLGCPTYLWAILEVANLLGGSFARSLVAAVIVGLVLASYGV